MSATSGLSEAGGQGQAGWPLDPDTHALPSRRGGLDGHSSLEGKLEVCRHTGPFLGVDCVRGGPVAGEEL